MRRPYSRRQTSITARWIAFTVLTALLALGPAVVRAQDITFQPLPAQTMTNQISGMAVGDLNRNGVADILTVDAGTGAVTLRRGLGDGTFDAPVDLRTPSPSLGPMDVAIGDLNRDSRPDVVVADFNANRVTIFLAAAAGTFTQSFIDFSGARAVAIGDVNRDGKPDLVVADFLNNRVGVLLGDGAGQFSAPGFFGVNGLQPEFILVTDLDRDGRLDVVTANSASHNLSVLYGNGNGTLSNIPLLLQVRSGNGPFDVAAADLDGDGRPDLVAANGDVAAITVFRATGARAFAQGVESSTGSTPVSVAIGDFNGDGKPDLAVARATGHVSVLVGNGSATFVVQTNDFVDGVPASIVSVDLDLDGRPDLLVGRSNGSFVVLRNTTAFAGGGFLTAPVSYPVEPFAAAVAVADFNRDGRPDIVVASSNAFLPSFSVLPGLGAGQFGSVTSAINTGSSPTDVIAADFNRDGIADVATANQNGTVTVFLASSAATLPSVPSRTVAVTDVPQALAAGDVNGDGALDLVVAGTSGLLSVLLGDGAGGFTRLLPDVSAGSGVSFANAVVLADFNGDGKLDLAVGYGNTCNVSILLGNGAGGFAPTQMLDLGGGCSAVSLAAGDIDRDGRPDLVATIGAGQDGRIRVFLNTGNAGNPIFAAAVFIPTFDLPATVALADMNRDGILDLVWGTGFIGGIGILRGTGDASLFEQSQTGGAANGSSDALAIADVDGDGRPDVVVGSGSNVVVLLNGPGVTLTVQLAGTGAGTVTSTAPGMNCPEDCSETYPNNTPVTLIATPDSSSVFTGWTNCAPTTAPSCTVMLDTSKTVTANFGATRVLRIFRQGFANGTVVSDPPGISCGDGGSCIAAFPIGTPVILTAIPQGTAVVDRWNGNCTPLDEKQTQCRVVMTVTQIIEVIFDLTFALNVDRSGAGAGRVVSTPPGIDCSGSIAVADCTERYKRLTTVTLVATAEPGSIFDGWTNCPNSSSGTTCNAFVTEPKPTVIAAFAPAVTLVVDNPLGAAVVTSDQGGITCGGPGADCSELYKAGTVVTLTAAVPAGSNFQWSGCPAPSGLTCVVTMDATRTVTANLLFTVAAGTTGGGTVTSAPAGIDCGSDCADLYPGGSVVTLTARAELGFRFDGWTGDCATANPCLLLVTRDHAVGARFVAEAPRTLAVTSTGTGRGTITSNIPGIECGANCSEAYPYGQTVILTALPAADSIFNVWKKCPAASNNTCTVLMTGAAITGVEAEFVRKAVVQFATGTFTVAEGAGAATIEVIRTGFLLPPVTVGFTVTTGTAVDGSDFTGRTGTLSFGPNITSQKFTIAIANDQLREADQTITLFLSNPLPTGAVLGEPSQAIVIIGDDDPGRVAPFNGPSLLDVGGGPAAVAGGDLDGDGQSDIVVANRDDDSVSIMLATGGTSFAPRQDWPVQATPMAVVVGDVNGDGIPDLVTANRDANSISVLLGDGQGGISSTAHRAAGVNPIALVLADVDGDGTLDAIVANATGTISVLIGDGHGDFAAQPVPVELAANVAALAAGDVNGDGKRDLVAIGNDGGRGFVRVLLAGPGGILGPPAVVFDTGLPGPPGPRSVYSIAVDDLDRDGRADILVGFAETVFDQGQPELLGRLTLLRGKGDGTFQRGPTTALGKFLPRTLTLLDADGDSVLDVAMVSDVTSEAAVALGDATGNFGLPVPMATGITGALDTQPTALVAADVDGDKRPDLAVANTATNQVAVFLNAFGPPNLIVKVVGKGTVTSNKGGITCPTDCKESYARGLPIVLTATPSAGYRFKGWSEDCSGSAPCALTMSHGRQVTATFEGPLGTLNISRMGAGRVTGDGIDCPLDCGETVLQGTMLTLTATPTPGAAFQGWSVTACGTGPTCSVTVAAATLTVTARFTDLDTLKVVRAGTGTGTVTADVGAINCGAVCEVAYQGNTRVTLTANPALASGFTSWAGCTPVTGAPNQCTITMNSSLKLVTATFTTLRLTVNRIGSGTGTVTATTPAATIDCGSDCTELVAPNTTFTLAAAAGNNSVFTSWSNCTPITGTPNRCTTSLTSANKTVVATFTTARLTTGRTGSGRGTVTCVVNGVDVGADCTRDVTPGTAVSFLATPADDSSFLSWTGCSPATANPCTVTVRTALTVTATFNTSRLTISKAGLGVGTVTSTDGTINCGADCVEDIKPRNTVTLTAVAGNGSVFGSWMGCTPATAPQCQATMDVAKTVFATFNSAPLTVSKVGLGTGRVTGPGIDCGDDCFERVLPSTGTNIVLTAVVDAPFTFGGWQGCAPTSASPPQCQVTMGTTAKTVVATFSGARLQVTKSGLGSVTAVTPAGAIDCGSDCVESVAVKTKITLDAVPAANADFTSWVGCTPVAGVLGRCTVALDTPTLFKATATFTSSKLEVKKTGLGTVTGPGVDCGSDCSESFRPKQLVTLTAAPAPGHVLSTWAGCAPVKDTPTCVADMTASRTVTANFIPTPLRALEVQPKGFGSVTSSVGGIACPNDCTKSLPQGTAVTLTAAPASADPFLGWSDNCAPVAGTPTQCVVVVGAPVKTVVVANFTLKPVAKLQLTIGGTGTVALSPEGLPCGRGCFSYLPGTQVTLTAQPGSQAQFKDWPVGCDDKAGVVCSVTLTSTTTSRPVTAQFQSTLKVTSITISPSSTTTSVGNPVQFTATATSNGVVVVGLAFTWRLGDDSVAVISPTGRAVAVAPGTTSVTASFEGVTGTASLTVNRPVDVF